MKKGNTNNKGDVISMECKKCGGKEHSKNGFIKGHQRYKCKNCGYQFVPTLQKGFDEQTKLTACLLYISGLSLRTIARLLHTSATSVLSWVKKFALENYEKPQPNSEAVVIQIDEMWHFLNLKKTKFGYGKHTVLILDNLLIGSVVIVILIH